MANVTKNPTTKAFTSWLAKNCRDEWMIGVNTNGTRKGYKVYDQHELKAMFDRYGECSDGATKAVHKLNYIVVKRHKPYGYQPSDPHSCGNQLIDEINCFLKYNDKPESDFLCPILKYYTSKSDKVTATSETMQDNVLIVAQKAEKVGTLWEMCQEAYERNGYKGETPIKRYDKMVEFSNMNHWRDAVKNGGNSGVIYDYRERVWKAVFIDYAL